MQTFMRFPGGRCKAVTLSYDDGVEQDARLMQIMDRHGIKGTFNLNSELFAPEETVYPAGQIHRRLTRQQALALYGGSGHEVAVHGATHPFLEQLPAASAVSEILRDRQQLEALFGGTVRGMAYPFGTYSDDVVEALRLCGIVYARTAGQTGSFALPADWLRMTGTCHHNHPDLAGLTERFLAARTDRGPSLFYLWGHSYEFEADGNWRVIEDFCARIGGREDVWYATNIEIYDYVTAYSRLQYNAAGTLVHNPSAMPVWVQCGGLHEIPAGADVTLA